MNGQIFKINEALNSYSIYYQLKENLPLQGSFWYFFNDENDMVVIGASAISKISSDGAVTDLTHLIQSNSIITNAYQNGENIYLPFSFSKLKTSFCRLQS